MTDAELKGHAFEMKKLVDDTKKETGLNILGVRPEERRNHSWGKVFENFAYHDYDEELKRMKGSCKSSDDCSVLTNYVDDVKGDASGQHDATFWKVLRLYFTSEDPVDCLLHLGVKTEGPLEHLSRYCTGMSQVD